MTTVDNYETSSTAADTFIFTMFPLAKSSYLFNGANEQEWQISRNTNTKFVVYGMVTIFEDSL
jgi:hypothetical protein